MLYLCGQVDYVTPSGASQWSAEVIWQEIESTGCDDGQFFWLVAGGVSVQNLVSVFNRYKWISS